MPKYPIRPMMINMCKNIPNIIKKVSKKHSKSVNPDYPDYPIHHYMILVGGSNTSEQYDFVSWDDEIPNGKS